MKQTNDSGPRSRSPFPVPQPIPNSLSGVPFIDAYEGTSEIPLDHIDSFVIPAQDQNHVSEAVHVRMPPYLVRGMKLMIASGRFPYLTDGDFIRHACMRHLIWLATIRQSVQQHLRVGLAQAAEVCADDELRTQIENSFARIEERVQYHLSNGHLGEVIRLVNTIKSRMSGVHDSARMREWKARFEKTYGHFLHAAVQSKDADAEEIQ